MMMGEFQYLSETLTTLAVCVRLQRQDGLALGFTSHDQVLHVGGLDYIPPPGIKPSAVTHGEQLADAMTGIEGIFSGGGITQADLRMGR